MAKKSAEKAVETLAAEPTLVFGFDVSEFLRRVGVDVAQIEAQALAWAAANPGQALPIEVAISFVRAEFSGEKIANAMRVVATGVVELVQTGKGPVQHSGSEVV